MSAFFDKELDEVKPVNCDWSKNNNLKVSETTLFTLKLRDDFLGEKEDEEFLNFLFENIDFSKEEK